MKNVEPETYHYVFQQDPAGKEIFDELTRVFYDIQSFDPDNTHKTAFNEGQRSVVRFIINKMLQAENNGEQ